MDKFIYTLVKSCLILLFILSTPTFVFAQAGSPYPDDEAAFMAQANRLYQNRDYKRYMEMLTTGVQRGYAQAEGDLGAIYMTTPGKDGKVRYDLAVKLFTRSANKGNATSMYMLATCYRGGLGVAPSMELYRHWMRRAAKAGSVEAQRACQDENLACW